MSGHVSAGRERTRAIVAARSRRVPGLYSPTVLGAILTAMVTPFDAELKVDEGATARLARHLVDQGASEGLVVAGTTGEASTLDDEEKLTLVRIAAREVGDRASIVGGAGSNDTDHSVRLAERMGEAGADAVLAVTPYYNKPPRAGLVAHFEAIARVGVPVVLYNIPGRTAVNMPPDLIAEIAELPGVIALKEANDDPAQRAGVAGIEGLDLYAGNDDMLLPVLELGGAGVISVASHLVGPEMAAMVAAARRTDWDEARRIDADLAGLVAGLFMTSNPILIKAALAMAGLIPDDALRLPLVPATPVERSVLKTVLGRHVALTNT